MNGATDNVRVVERNSRLTPLGIRFWDPVLEAAVREGLYVTLEPSGYRATPLVGAITPSGAYAFHHVPGLAGYESGAVQNASPPDLQNYVVHIRDTRRRYLETAFALDLPLDDPGALLGRPVSSPAADYVPGVFLYAAPARRAPATIGVVRSTLRQLNGGRAASHAMVVVTDADGRRWPAVADASGQVVALFPYPAPATSTTGSPPRVAVSPLPSQTWPLTLEVFHSPALQPLHVGVPDYREILSQPPVGVAQNLDSPTTLSASWSGTLQYGMALAAKSGGGSELWIGEPGSP